MCVALCADVATKHCAVPANPQGFSFILAQVSSLPSIVPICILACNPGGNSQMRACPSQSTCTNNRRSQNSTVQEAHDSSRRSSRAE